MESQYTQTHTTENLFKPAADTPQFPDPKKRGRRSKWLIGAIIFVLLAALAVSFVIYNLKYKTITAEQHFYKALENHLSVKTIRQEYAVKDEYYNFTLDNRNDFTDPRLPKMTTTFSYNYYASDSSHTIFEGRAVGNKPEEVYVIYDKMTTEWEQTDVELVSVRGQWIHAGPEVKSILNDPVYAIQGVNTPLGEIIVGDFDKELRQEILDMIRSEQVYTIRTSEEVERDGVDSIKYQVVFNKDGSNKLNNFVAERLGIKKLEDRTSDTEATVWVDKGTSRFSGVMIKKEGFEVVTKLSGYNEPVDVDIPSEAMSYEDSRKRLKDEADTIIGDAGPDGQEVVRLPGFVPIAAPVASLQIIDLVEGTGSEVGVGATVTVHFKLALATDGIVMESTYDRGQPFTSPLGGLIRGWQEGIPGMKVGGKRRIIVPATLAYVDGRDMVFDIELISFE